MKTLNFYFTGKTKDAFTGVALVACAISLGSCSHHASNIAEINQLVAKRLAADSSLKGEKISVSANSTGVVVLSGLVTTNKQMRAAVSDANILGVITKVMNHLQSQQDLNLEARFQRIITAPPFMQGANFRVFVRNDNVRLQGTYLRVRQREFADTVLKRNGLKLTDQSRLVTSKVAQISRKPGRQILATTHTRPLRAPRKVVRIRPRQMSIDHPPKPYSSPVPTPAHKPLIATRTTQWGFFGTPIKSSTKPVAMANSGASWGFHPTSQPTVHPTPAQPPQPAAPQPVTLQVGTTLQLRLETALSSASSQPGEKFQGELAVPVILAGHRVIPVHASVQGVVLFAHSAGHYVGRSELSLTLSNISYDGHIYGVMTAPWSKYSAPRGANTAKSVGIGGAAGAILGGIFGGGKGATYGAGIGAGAGAVKQALIAVPEVALPIETVLTFQLNRPLTVMPEPGMVP